MTKRLDGKRQTPNDGIMTCDCATTRILLAACAWLGLICQQVTVACGCCTFAASSAHSDQTPACCADEMDSAAFCCGPDTDRQGSMCCEGDTSASGSRQISPATGHTRPCCGSCCHDVPMTCAVLVSRLPVPAAVAVLTPIVINEPAGALSKSQTHRSGDAAEQIPLLRRLARLGVWRN